MTDRFPGGKLPAFLFYAFLLAYLGLHWGLEAAYSFCWFKRITGINCPTCGLSRSFLALLHGKPLQALLFNPLMLACTLFILLQQSSTLLCKRRLALEASPGEKLIATAVLVVLFILNWLYVMVTVA